MPWRRRVARWRLQARRPTGFLRGLPDLLIIGAQRCGTSSLYTYLGQHPQVSPSIRKEIEFFSTRYGEGINWYRAHFPLRFASHSFTFEATPDYLLHPLAAERARSLVPEAKVIAMLRDPVDRAYSQYQHNRRLGNEPLSFAQALEAEPSRVAGEFERLVAEPAYSGTSLRRYGYVARGKYYEQVRRWTEAYPADQILFIRSEDFFAAPDLVYAGVLRFLGLPEAKLAEFRNHSIRPVNTLTKSLPVEELGDSIRDRLVEVFAEDTERVYELVNRDYGWLSARTG